MQEFLDLRTLSVNNILMSLSFAACLLIYSKYNRDFKGIKRIGYAFVVSATAFLLLGLRGYIPNFASIVVPNALFILSMSLIHIGFTHFYQLDVKVIKRVHAVLILIMILLASIYTYVDNSVNARIAVLSFIVSVQCLLIVRTLLTAHNKANFTLAFAYLLFAIFFSVRGVLTLYEEPLYEFMTAGFLHTAAVVVFELLIAVTAFGIVWIVSHKVQRALSDQASQDPLTNVLNRRALEECVNIELSRALRNQTPMSIIMLDIDHFKQINDQFGHGVGDKVLVKIAQILTKNSRQYDRVSRIGGEEFIIVLPETTAAHARSIAEKLRRVIADYKFSSTEQDEPLKVTSSFGVTECYLAQDNWLKILERVDNALYAAKAQGRNCVVVHNENNQGAQAYAAG